jgi:subtilisin family serine protease
MAKRPVIIELAAEPMLAEAAATASLQAEPIAALSALPGLDLDPTFAPVPLPRLADSGAAFALVERETDDGDAGGAGDRPAVVASYIVRGDLDEDEMEAVAQRPEVVGVFADVGIEPALICPGSPPLGTDADVERLLCVPRLRGLGADGRGVLVAIVDSGINLAYLNSRGKNPGFDAARSWTWQSGLTPGSMPVGHGTMCAYDVCIAAPACTLIDVALLRPIQVNPAGFHGLLSDAVRAFSHLADIMRAPRRPGESRSLVVNNSWGMFNPSWDYPPGDRRNYSHNPMHPFNVIVGTLEGLGADILFAAGNCGSNCPDSRCGGITTGTIRGANGHPKVLCVAGVDTTSTRVGYSSQGPGLLDRNKPDLCGFTHFRGSGVYAADGGTSAATPVVAGLVAAYRSAAPFQPDNPSASPEAVRNLFRSTCRDLGTNGYDFDHGFGVVSGCAIANRFGVREPQLNLCALIPGLCERIRVPVDICQLYPHLCQDRIPFPRIPGRPGMAAGEGEYGLLDLGQGAEALESLSRAELAQLLYRLGQLDAERAGQPAAQGQAGSAKPAKCGCAG